MSETQSGVGMRRAKANLFGRTGREPPKTRPVRRAGRAGGSVRFSPWASWTKPKTGGPRRIGRRDGAENNRRMPAIRRRSDHPPAVLDGRSGVRRSPPHVRRGPPPPFLLCGEESGGRLCARVAGGGSVSFGGRRRGNPGRPLTVRRGVAACNAGSERAARTAGGCGPRGAADSGPRALQRGIGPLAGPARGMRHEAARPFAGAFVFVNRMCYLCLPKRITRLC